MTAVHVSRDTKDRLDRYREAIGAASYEEAIIRLLRVAGEESAFGTIPNRNSWKQEDRFSARSDEGDI